MSYPNIKNWTPVVNELLETYSQSELSRLTGIAQSSISFIASGDARSNLSYPRAIALLRLLGEPTDKKLIARLNQEQANLNK